MRRKKRKLKRPDEPPCFVFTLETIMIMQKAMRLFEQAFGRADSQAANATFAAETMHQVNGKLETMRTSVSQMCLTTFDYNEKIILAMAIQLYTLDLLSNPAHSRRERELQQCRQIARFALDDHKTERY